MGNLSLNTSADFTPLILTETKKSDGLDLTLKNNLDDSITKGKDPDALAKCIEVAVKDVTGAGAETKQLQLIEKSLAYIRETDRGLSLRVSENLTDAKKDNGYVDVFGTENKIPEVVTKDDGAKKAWDNIASGIAYDYIEKNKDAIKSDLDAPTTTTDGTKTVKVGANSALAQLKTQLMESNCKTKNPELKAKEADEDISTMLKQVKDCSSNNKPLLALNEQVKIEILTPAILLESNKKALSARIDQAATPEQAKKILEESIIRDFEPLRPKNIKEHEQFYSKQMQEVLKGSTKYKDYAVAATAELNAIEFSGRRLIPTNQDKVYVNSRGKFVNNKDEEYEVDKDKQTIKVGDDSKAIKDIKPAEPTIHISMDKDPDKVAHETLGTSREYLEDLTLVNRARDDDETLRELAKAGKILDKGERAVEERARQAIQDKRDNGETLSLIVGLACVVGTIALALSQGGGRTTTITGGGGYNGYNGYNGQGGFYPVSDRYGYNRGYQATVNAAYERSNQYLSTFYDNPVRTRAQIMRENGTAAIEGRNGGPGVYGLT